MCHFVTFALDLLQVVLVFVSRHLYETLQAQVWRLGGDFGPAERTHFLLVHTALDAGDTESVTAWEKDIWLVVRWEEQLEAYRARVRHHLVIQALLSVELSGTKLLWLWQLLVVARLELRRHSCK